MALFPKPAETQQLGLFLLNKRLIRIFVAVAFFVLVAFGLVWRELYGHQIVAHLAPDEIGHRQTSKVDGDAVPVRHFGAVLSMEQWHAAADKLKQAGIDFIIEPHVRFKGEVGEQATMFFLDPSGNALEFKAFADMSSLFAK